MMKGKILLPKVERKKGVKEMNDNGCTYRKNATSDDMYGSENQDT